MFYIRNLAEGTFTHLRGKRDDIPAGPPQYDSDGNENLTDEESEESDIAATPIRKALPTSGKQQSKCEQVLPKKPRSALKKDLTAFFSKGKRSPVPTTAGNPIETVIQRRELQRGTPTGKGDSGAGAGGADG